MSIYCQYSSIIFCYAPQAHALTLTHADCISRTSPNVRLLGSSQRASCVSSSASCACPSSNRCLALNDHHKAPRFSSLPIKASKVQAKKHQKALGLRNDSKIFKIHISSVSINLHLHLLHVFCTRSSLTTRLLRQNTFAPPAFQKVFTPETLFSKKTMKKHFHAKNPQKSFAPEQTVLTPAARKPLLPHF